MTDQNKTSGEAEIVEWLLKEVSLDLTDFDEVYNYVEEVNDLHPKVAETIQRLVAERDTAISEPPLTCPAIDALIAKHSPSDEIVRELDHIRDINSQLRYGLWHEQTRAIAAEAARDFNAGRVHESEARLEAAEARIAELEADLQLAMEALEPFVRAALGVGTVWSDDLKLNHPEVDHVLPLITVGDLRRARATLKGKQP